MIYVFSVLLKGKIFWYKNLSDLPIDDVNEVKYFIYPVYQIGDKNYNLQREQIYLKNYGFSSPYNFLYDYLKQENVQKIETIFIQLKDGIPTVYYNDESYIDYNIQTKYCYRIKL
jgi:hypothetical protein